MAPTPVGWGDVWTWPGGKAIGAAGVAGGGGGGGVVGLGSFGDVFSDFGWDFDE